MFTIRKIDENYEHIAHVKWLYRQAFPKDERDSFELLLCRNHDESDLVAFENDGVFCGFAFMINFGELTHIFYFAIDGQYRNHGLGALALKKMHEYKKNHRFFVDVESPDESAENNRIRLSRIMFYSKNGYEMSDIDYHWNQVHYKIMTYGGTVTEEDFEEFWNHFSKFEDLRSLIIDTFRPTGELAHHELGV